MWKLDHKEGWAPKNWYFLTVVLEKTLENPLDCKEIKPVNPKGNEPWILIGRTNAEADGPILWPPDVKSWHIGKDPDAGKDWKRKERGQQRMRWLDGITDSMAMTLSKPREIAEGRGGWSAAVHGVAKSWTWLGNWTTAANGWQSSLPGQSWSAVLMQTGCNPSSSRQDGWSAAGDRVPVCWGRRGAILAGKLEDRMLYMGRRSSSFRVLPAPSPKKSWHLINFGEKKCFGEFSPL